MSILWNLLIFLESGTRISVITSLLSLCPMLITCWNFCLVFFLLYWFFIYPSYNVCFYLDRILNALLGFSKVFQVLTSCKKVLTFITVWWLQMVSQSGSSQFYKKQTWANKDNTCALIGQKLIIFSTGKLLAILNSHSLFYHTL